jgi:hypothetical protein
MSTTPSSQRGVSPWALGLVMFAGSLMIVGFFQFIQRLVAVIDDGFLVVMDKYSLEIDTTTWGWIHLIMGAIVAIAGYFVMRGDLWARILAMIRDGAVGDHQLPVDPVPPALIDADPGPEHSGYLGPGHLPLANLTTAGSHEVMAARRRVT